MTDICLMIAYLFKITILLDMVGIFIFKIHSICDYVQHCDIMHLYIYDIQVHLNDLNELISSQTNKQLPSNMEIKKKICNLFELKGFIREFSKTIFIILILFVISE